MAFLTFTFQASAADPYLDYASPSSFTNVQPTNYNDQWNPSIINAISAWNSSPSPAAIAYNTSSPNYIIAQQFSDSWYGLCAQYHGTYHYTISLNSESISADADNFGNFVQSCLVHEYGHVFWLCDNPDTTDTTIMDYGRDRNTMIDPQTFDINNVNAIF